jgi:hypothetical protein
VRVSIRGCPAAAALPNLQTTKCNITFSDGYLGSRNDEERSEMRYVLRLAEPSESSNLRTHLAPPGHPEGILVGVSAEYRKTS